MNVLGACYQNPAAVLDIVDCTKHTGKDIAERFCPHIEQLDPKHEDTDLVCFDGASNVQSGGKVLLVYFPRITSLHGVEHRVSLFFQDLSKLALVQNLIVKYHRVYVMFGS